MRLSRTTQLALAGALGVFFTLFMISVTTSPTSNEVRMEKLRLKEQKRYEKEERKALKEKAKYAPDFMRYLLKKAQSPVTLVEEHCDGENLSGKCCTIILKDKYGRIFQYGDNCDRWKGDSESFANTIANNYNVGDTIKLFE